MQEYWSPAETFDQATLASLQTRRLRALLQYAHAVSPYYRERFAACGLEPAAVQGPADLRRLPLTTKAELTADIDPGAAIFYRQLFLDDPRNILRWHRTSGTSGQPVRIGDTKWDWYAYADLSAEALYAMGLRRDDTVVIPFGYGPFIAFWIYISALERIGAALVPAGGMDTRARLDLMREFRATTLITTPSYAMHLAGVAASAGLDLRRDTGVRLIITTGEPRTAYLRQRITELWGVPTRDRIGSAETGGIAYECPHCPGLYHLQETQVIAEVIDVDTGEPVRPGETGELIVTPLYRRGMPLLRFRTGNRVQLAPAGPRPCGRQLMSLAATENGVVLNRTDALFKVRGVLIDPLAVEQAVRRFPQCSDHFQVRLSTVGDLDEVTVRVETRHPLAPADQDGLVSQLQSALRSALSIRTNVEVLPPGSFQLDGNKVKRVVDLRRKGVHHG